MTVAVKERFWILRGGWYWERTPGKPRGRLFSGPYSTFMDALHARSAIETLTTESFWIEQEPPISGEES